MQLPLRLEFRDAFRDPEEAGKVVARLYAAPTGSPEPALQTATAELARSQDWKLGDAGELKRVTQDDTASAWMFHKKTTAPMAERFEYARTEGKAGLGGFGGGGQPYFLQPYPAAPKEEGGGKMQGGQKAKDTSPPAGGGGRYGGGYPGTPPPPAADQKGNDKKEAEGLRPNSTVVLQYAHVHSPVGADLQNMVLWHPLLIAEDGTARAAFDLSANPATYRITIYGHTSAGRLGVFHGKLETRK